MADESRRRGRGEAPFLVKAETQLPPALLIWAASSWNLAAAVGGDVQDPGEAVRMFQCPAQLGSQLRGCPAARVGSQRVTPPSVVPPS